VLFISKFSHYRIGLIPDRYTVDQFQRRILVRGKSAQFEDGKFETNDKDTIKLLTESPYYGNYFWSPENKAKVTEEARNIMAKEAESAEATLTSCPYCSFNAKNHFGLMSHLRGKHKDK
jgi:signal peptidase I